MTLPVRAAPALRSTDLRTPAAEFVSLGQCRLWSSFLLLILPSEAGKGDRAAQQRHGTKD